MLIYQNGHGWQRLGPSYNFETNGVCASAKQLLFFITAEIESACGEIITERACDLMGDTICDRSQCTCTSNFVPTDDRTACECGVGMTLDRNDAGDVTGCVDGMFKSPQCFSVTVLQNV